MNFTGTKHNDTFHGAGEADNFDLFQGGHDTATGGAGEDLFNMGAKLDAGEVLDGGADYDIVDLSGNYAARTPCTSRQRR